jgi:hypothetical protein
LWLLRFFTVDASFHFIHAQDIASITNHLLESDIKNAEFVLGNKAVTADFLIKEVCGHFKKKIYFQIPISVKLVKILASIFRKRLSPWDIYCLNNRHQIFKAVNARTFGIASNSSTIEEILKIL